MTDDEIRAAIVAIPNSARFFPPNTTEIAIYRAGMLRAAQIARDESLPSADNDVDATYNLYNIGLRKAAAVIERAASEPPAA